MINSTDENNKNSKFNAILNIKSTLLYAISTVIALGINGLVTSVFDSFPYSKHIIAKITYVTIMIGVSVILAAWMSTNINTI